MTVNDPSGGQVWQVCSLHPKKGNRRPHLPHPFHSILSQGLLRVG